MTPDERAALEALADRWGATHWPIHAQQLRAVLAAHPDTPAPTDLLDRFPAPVLPEGAVPLADGWHLKRDPNNARGVTLHAPDGAVTSYTVNESWLRSHGQPVPSPVRVGPEGLSEAETRRIAKEWTEADFPSGDTDSAACRLLARACREQVAEWDGSR